jgi:hypothetical protein
MLLKKAIVFDFLNGTGDIIDVSINDACSDLWNLAMSEIVLLCKYITAPLFSTATTRLFMERVVEVPIGPH